MVQWEGDFRGVDAYVRAMFGAVLPGVTRPWPSAVEILIGPRAEHATAVGLVEAGLLEPVDVAAAVVREVRRHLDLLSRDRTTATITLRPVFEEGDEGEESEPFSRTFTRPEATSSAASPTQPSAPDPFSAVAATLSRAVAPPSAARAVAEDEDMFGGFETPRIPQSQVVSDRPIEYEGVRLVLNMFSSEIQAQRAVNANLTSQLVTLLGSMTQSATRDAERYAMEAASTRAAVASLDKQHAAVVTERDYLQERVEELETAIAATRRGARRALEKVMRSKKKQRREPAADPASAMFNEVAEQVAAAIKNGVAGAGAGAGAGGAGGAPPPAEPEPEAPPTIPIGAPTVRRRGRPRKNPSGGGAPAAAPSGGGMGDFMSTIMGGGFTPDKIADLIANLPGETKAGIVKNLAKKYPAAAAALAESLADETEEQVREIRRQRGEPVDDEDEDEDEDEASEKPDDEDEDEDEDQEEDEDEEEDEDAESAILFGDEEEADDDEGDEDEDEGADFGDEEE